MQLATTGTSRRDEGFGGGALEWGLEGGWVKAREPRPVTAIEFTRSEQKYN